jgi:hypothetical protein
VTLMNASPPDVNVKTETNHDFTALQKTSLNAATPAVTVSDKTGFSLSAAGILGIWNQLLTGLVAVGSIGKKLADWVVGTIDTYTGNTKQTGDSFIKVNQLTFTTPNKVDATISGGGDATLANQTLIKNALATMSGVGFNTATDSLEAIRNRGDTAWLTGGGMTGSRTLTINIHDNLGNNVVDAFVDIWDSVGTTFMERRITNSSGQIISHPDDGTYTIRIRKAGFTFADQTIIIIADAAVTYIGTSIAPPAPISVDVCRFFHYFETQGPDPVLTLEAKARIVSLPFSISGAMHVGTLLDVIYDPITGFGYWDITIGATVYIVSQVFGLKHYADVPLTGGGTSVDFYPLLRETEAV